MGLTHLEILAGTPRGGGQDRAARALAAALDPVAVEIVNLPGRGGGNAWDALVARTAEPWVVAISSPTLITNRLLGTASIDDRDLTPLANLYTEYVAFAVPAGSPITDATELAAMLAASPPPVTAFATAVGNVNHIALARVARRGNGAAAIANVTRAARVFDSAPQAVASALAGSADVVVVSVPSIVREAATGSLRVLALSAPHRLTASLPDVPTWTELGVPCDLGIWRGLVAPPQLEPADIEATTRLVAGGVAGEGWRSVLADRSWTDTWMAGHDLARFLDTQRAEMAAALSELGLVRGR